MTQDELRQEYMRFANLQTIKDCEDLIDIFLEYIWEVLNNHRDDQIDTLAQIDAKVINQMMFNKLTHTRVLLKGVGYDGSNGISLSKINDPTIMAILVRNIFETVSVFNLIFRYPKKTDEQTIIYNLWVISGLKYRQNFKIDSDSEKNIKRDSEEKKYIEKLITEIKETERYKSLPNDDQKEIDKKIKRKDFKITFEGNKVNSINAWQDLCDIMGIKKDILKNIYSFFSLYTHPSQVSVFQFSQMYCKENEAYKSITIFILNCCFSFVSIFIADYIHLFPQVIKTFELLPINKQIIINTKNIILRGYNFSINDCYKALG